MTDSKTRRRTKLLAAAAAVTMMAAAFTMQAAAHDKQEIERDALAWMDQTAAAAGTDLEAFKGLFGAGISEDTIQSYFYEDWSNYTGKDQHFATLVIDADPYFYVDITSAICSGTYPDTSVEYSDWAGAFQYNEAGTFVCTGSDDAINAINEKYFDVLPSGMKEASQNGRNCTEFDAYKFWYLDSSHVVQGALDASLRYAWQDEEGNLWLALLAYNGTGANRSFTSIHLTLKDDVLGTVYDGGLDGFSLMNGQNTLKVYQIPFSEVLTGTGVWGSMNSHVSTDNL